MNKKHNIEKVYKRIEDDCNLKFYVIRLIKQCYKDGIINADEYDIYNNWCWYDSHKDYLIWFMWRIKNDTKKYTYQLVNQGFYCRVCKNDKDSYLRKVNNQLIYYCNRCKRSWI